MRKLLNKIPSWETLMKWEPWAFAIMVLIGWLPVVVPHYFSTLDGPAHLYNAHLIKQMLLGDGNSLHDFFMFNELAIPNWGGHAIMTFFISFLPDYLAEKGFLLVYLTLTPLFFRKFVLAFSPKNQFISWIAIPFAHHHLLYFGFYNMCTGLMFLFITIFYFKKHCAKLNWKNFIGLTVLLLCTYFSHLSMYIVCLGILAILCLPHLKFIKPFWANAKTNLLPAFKHAVFVLAAAIPSLLLTGKYLAAVHGSETYNDTPPLLNDAIRFVLNIKPLITIRDQAPYTTYANIIFGLLLLFLIVGLVRFFKNIRTEFSAEKLPNTLFKLVLALMTIVFLVLFFIMPNIILMTERLILIFYFLYILILALPRYPKWIHVLAFLVIVYVHHKNSRHLRKSMAEISHSMILFQENVNYIKEGGTVLTVNYIDNWLMVHSRGYLGSSKPIVLLQNYEASLKWFPLKWNNEKYHLGRLSDWGSDTNNGVTEYYVNRADTTIFSLKRIDGTLMPIEYFVVFESVNASPPKMENEGKEIQRVLDQGYHLIHQNEVSKLYRLKK